MRYLDQIKRYIEILLASEKFHLLCISGAPGWAKTHTTRKVLQEAGATYCMLGSYSTPLALYNHLCEFPESILVIDDTAGLFYNPQALSILNAATWPGIAQNGHRVVTWTSTSEKVSEPSVEFGGKIIVLTNFFPDTPQARAFINRSLHYQIRLNGDLIAELLLAAANSSHFDDNETAATVAKFLGDRAKSYSSNHKGQCPISLRTLEMGIEFAKSDPEGWHSLIENALPLPLDSSEKTSQEISDPMIVRNLDQSGMMIEQQFEEYQRQTGKSRRAFFYHRKRLGLSKKNVTSSHPRV